MYHFRAEHGPVALAFTDRHGGVSRAPFDSLDLASAASPGDPRARERNLALLVDDFAPGCSVAQMSQVHGRAVDVVPDRRVPERRTAAVADDDAPPEADAMLTWTPEEVLLVRAADCVPVVLADADRGLVAVAHAGRPGVEQGVVTAVLEAMAERGATDVHAWIGPHVCGRCYEVPEDLQRRVAAAEPATLATTSWGTPSLDIGAGVRAQLERGGAHVHEVGGCTRESGDLFSYRRDGADAGRLAGVVVIRA